MNRINQQKAKAAALGNGIFVVCTLLFLASMPAVGQRFGYLDSRKIVEQMPEFKQAEQQLNAATGKWQKEIDNAKKELAQLREELGAEEILMAPEMMRYQMQKVKKREEELLVLQDRYFGFEGELFMMRYELMQPIQEKVEELIKRMCRKHRLGYVFDKSANILILYADTKHNFTEATLEILKPKEEEEALEDERARKEEKPQPVPAERIGYVNTQAILQKMPQYKEVTDEMDRQRKRWEAGLKKQQQLWLDLQAAYDEEQIMLTQEMKDERLEEIQEAKEDFIRLNNEIFGPDGLLFTRRMEFLKPLQDKVFEAVEKVAEEKRLDFVFDKLGDVSMIYASPIYDYSDYVLEELGLGDPADTVR